ncbi:TPA: 3-oxoacyl-ACP reductase FabG [Pseudomonas putida]|nr:3-oxoacyl-ACP reductase FabG [Pseudomonas putida]
MKKLENKVALVTGSSKGIGAEIARTLAEQGAVVVINYTSSQREVEALVNSIVAKGGKAYAIKADVSDSLQVKSMFAAISSMHEHLDILVNNAGVYATAALEEISEAEFHRHFNLNVLGVILCSQAAARLFGEQGGNIINISSSVTSFTPANSTVYTASKGAVDAITKTLANELGPRNIRVNSVNPGLVETEGVHASGFFAEDFRRSIEAITPLGRIGRPQDIAPAVAFLASDDASWITGETLIVGGGLH